MVFILISKQAHLWKELQEIPIIFIGFVVYFDMEHGQTLKEYVDKNNFEIPATFTFVPVLNLIVVLAAIGMIIWNSISNFKKP